MCHSKRVVHYPRKRSKRSKASNREGRLRYWLRKQGVAVWAYGARLT